MEGMSNVLFALSFSGKLGSQVFLGSRVSSNGRIHSSSQPTRDFLPVQDIRDVTKREVLRFGVFGVESSDWLGEWTLPLQSTHPSEVDSQNLSG